MSWSFAVGGSAAPEIPDDESDGSEASRRIGRLPHGSRHRKLEMPRRVQSWVCELVRLLGSMGKTWPSPRLRLEMRVNRWRHRVRHSRQCWTVLGPTFLGRLRSGVLAERAIDQGPSGGVGGLYLRVADAAWPWPYLPRTTLVLVSCTMESRTESSFVPVHSWDVLP